MCGHAHGAVGLDKLQSFIGSEGIGDARVGGPYSKPFWESSLLNRTVPGLGQELCGMWWLRVLTLISA